MVMPSLTVKQQEWLHESAWTFLGMLLSRGSAFLVSVAAARLFTPADFAVFAIAQNFQVALTVLAIFGFANAMAKYVGREWMGDQESGARTLLLVWRWASAAAALMVVVLALAAKPIAQAVFGQAGAWWIVCLCAVAALASAQIGILSSAYAATVQMRRYSVLQARAALLVLPILIGVVVSGRLPILLTGWSVAFMLTAALLGWHLMRQLSLRRSRADQSTPRTRVPGLPSFVTAAGVANVLVYPMHAVVLGLIRSRHGNEEAAVYQVCVLWMTLLTLVPGTLANNLLAAAARSVMGGEEGAALRRSALRVMGGLACVVAVLGVALAPVVAAGYGRVMAGQWLCLAVISIAAAASTFTGGAWPSLMAVKGAKIQLWLNGVFAVGYVMAAIALVRGYGALGATIACAAGAILQTIVAYESLRIRQAGSHDRGGRQ